MSKKMSRSEYHRNKRNVNTENIEFTMDKNLDEISKLFDDINNNTKEESSIEATVENAHRSSYRERQEQDEIKDKIQDYQKEDQLGQTGAQIFSEALNYNDSELDLDKTQVVNSEIKSTITGEDNVEDTVRYQATKEILTDIHDRNDGLEDLLEQTIKLRELVQDIKDKNSHTQELLIETKDSITNATVEKETEQTILLTQTLDTLADNIEEVEQSSKFHTFIMFMLSVLLLLSIGLLIYVVF